MKKISKKTLIFLVVSVLIAALLIVGIVLTNGMGKEKESINEVMKDAVLHEGDKIAIGSLEVNPGLISSWVVVASILIFAVIFRIFIFPRFKNIPGRFQAAIETVVEYFGNLAESSNHKHSGFIGAYIFSAGVYIFVGTIFELFGIPVLTIRGPLSVCLRRFRISTPPYPSDVCRILLFCSEDLYLTESAECLRR